MTIQLPDELADQLAALVPEQDERDHFAVAAIADAVRLRQQEVEADERVLASLRARLDPDTEPERDSAECVAAVEEAMADMEAGRTYSLEEERAYWQQQKAALLAKANARRAA
jgi:predicted transcriptional regulator